MPSISTPLTSLTSAGGCGCKISPTSLETILRNLDPNSYDLSVRIGRDERDDASVFFLDDNVGLILTVDFFTPIVNDAYEYGAVAAANALSDVYAMGGRPIVAQAILGWPERTISYHETIEILRGAQFSCAQCNISIAGGHTINSLEPFFGLAVNGIVHVTNLKRNCTVSSGDLLFLTKPLGSGVLSNAEKKNLISPENRRSFLNCIMTINSIGAEFGKCDFVTAMTDVTGYGLIGHLFEMVKVNNMDSELYIDRLPVLPGFEEYLVQGCATSGSARNRAAFESLTAGQPDNNAQNLIFDPQTNGGLLVAVNPSSESAFRDLVTAHNHEYDVHMIGRVLDKNKESATINLRLFNESSAANRG